VRIRLSNRASKLAAPALAASLIVSLVSQGAAQQPPPKAPAKAAPAAPRPAPPPPPPPSAPAAPAGPAVPDESKKDEARAHFEKGLSLLQQDALAAALAEFLISRELYPTRTGTFNAGVALRKLNRYDEALDMFETLLREFTNMTPEARTEAQKQVAELRELVGTIEVKGAEPGSAIVISGQSKGEFPPLNPLRVSAGSHVVRLVKEGFEPFSTNVDVAGGRAATVTVKMKPLAASGRLKISERSGKVLEVYVDTAPVGVTPWEGRQPVGTHTIQLRSKGRWGTEPASIVVRNGETASASLTAVELDAVLHVDAKPTGAEIAIDTVSVGAGSWHGWLKSGQHKVEIGAPGFLPVVKQFKLERGAREVVNVQLERDPNSPLWQKPSRWAIDVSAGVGILPSFGGDVAGKCTGTCAAPVGLGGLGFFHAAYELGSGLGFGLSLGYLISAQSVTGRSAQLTPYAVNGSPAPQSGTADDSLRLSSFLGGANIHYHLGEKVPVLFRVGVGAMVGRIRDERKGTFKQTGGKSYETFSVADVQTAAYLYIDPEIKVGLRLGKHSELSLGAQVLMLLALKQPKWNETIEVGAGADGIGRYKPDALLGSFVFGVVPTVSYRYDF
jgi:hypothetical protein